MTNPIEIDPAGLFVVFVPSVGHIIISEETMRATTTRCDYLKGGRKRSASRSRSATCPSPS